MEDIQIWALDDLQAAKLEASNRMGSEQLLEEILIKNPGLLMEGLTLVGRQTPTERGPLDLLGVDGYGRLVVFELKRGTLTRDAVAQVIDYASYLDAMDLTDLANHISERSGTGGIEDIENFEEWYDRKPFEVEGLEALLPPRLFLVGLGADNRTERMVKFLADNSGMDISLLTFHGFEYEGKTLLAKQVEVEGESTPADSPPRRTRTYVSREERRRRLDALIKEHRVQHLFDNLIGMFRNNWRGAGERPVVYGYNITLRERTESGRASQRRYARVGPAEEGRMEIVFFPDAVIPCVDEFRPAVAQIPFRTWPRDQEEQALEDLGLEIQFLLTHDDWETHKETLTALTQAVYKAWEASGSSE